MEVSAELRRFTDSAGMVHVDHGNAKGEANDLIDRNYLDPISGFPGYKSYFCKIEKEKGEVKA